MKPGQQSEGEGTITGLQAKAVYSIMAKANISQNPTHRQTDRKAGKNHISKRCKEKQKETGQNSVAAFAYRNTGEGHSSHHR